jgi:malonyl CoA-acyl carrier protein transacylase
VLGLSPEKVQAVLDTMEPAADGKRVEVGLINSDKQAVIGGRIPDLDKAAALMQQAGAYAVKKARLNHAFHTSYLEDMEDEFSAFVDTLQVKDPVHKIILNCSADYAQSAADIVKDIKLQCCHTVLWRDSLKRLFELGELQIAECGNGHTMQGIIREAGFRDKVYLMSNPKELQMYVKLVKG